VVRVVRIRYAHSEPLFWRAKVEAVEAGNLESARLLAGGAADLGFMPITLAAELACRLCRGLPYTAWGP